METIIKWSRFVKGSFFCEHSFFICFLEIFSVSAHESFYVLGNMFPDFCSKIPSRFTSKMQSIYVRIFKMNTTSKIVIKVITKLYTVPYPGVSLGTPVLCKGSIYISNTL